MARSAPFDLQGRVLEKKRPLFVCVTLNARSIRAHGKPRLLLLEPPMRIVTVAAVHRSFENLVMERFCELRLRLVVTGHAQLRFALL
jgi:hypothetical protein